jgi:hypothetical protein
MLQYARRNGCSFLVNIFFELADGVRPSVGPTGKKKFGGLKSGVCRPTVRHKDQLFKRSKASRSVVQFQHHVAGCSFTKTQVSYLRSFTIGV